MTKNLTRKQLEARESYKFVEKHVEKTLQHARLLINNTRTRT